MERRELLAAGKPEVVVTLGGAEIFDNRTSPPVSFGEVVRYQPVPGPTRTFTVRNQGTAALTLSGVQVPGGYTVIEPLASSLAAGASDTFTVRLNTGAVGTFAGQIVIGNDDADESPFNFSITGRVTAPVVYVSINDVAQAEGDAGETDFTFTVSLSNAVLSGSLMLNYRARSGSVSFATGETVQTIRIPVVGDTVDEWDETCYVTLGLAGSNYVTLADGSGLGLIVDDHDPGANENPDVWRILHQSQCCCSTVCESDCQAVSTMNGGFVQELLDWMAELPVYFADATFNAAAAIFNFAVQMPDLGTTPDRITVKLDVGAHPGTPQTFPTAGTKRDRSNY